MNSRRGIEDFSIFLFLSIIILLLIPKVQPDWLYERLNLLYVGKWWACKSKPSKDMPSQFAYARISQQRR